MTLKRPVFGSDEGSIEFVAQLFGRDSFSQEGRVNFVLEGMLDIGKMCPRVACCFSTMGTVVDLLFL